MSSVFEGPLRLVLSDPQTGQLYLNNQVLYQLRTVTKKINCVSINGPSRTGKSYFANLLAGQSKGFQMGSTSEAITMGIWAWCIDPHPIYADQALLLLDTEGIGHVRKGDQNHDNKLFTLATLLSSTLIYNMSGLFDDDALNKLNFITEMSRNLKTSETDHATGSDDADFDLYFPEFILTLRNQTLCLENGGVAISPDEYLETCLETREGYGDDARRFNQPKECIKRYFKKRKCFVFDTPASSRQLANLENLTDSDLDQEFVKQKNAFLDYVLRCCRPMEMTTGARVTGRMFSSLAESYVEAIRQGAIPCIESALKSMAIIENEAAVKEAFDLYVQEMEGHAILPTKDAQALTDIHMHSADLAFKHFTKHHVLDDDCTYKDKLNETVHNEYPKWVTMNEEISRKKCNEVLAQLHNEIHKSAEYYTVSGGYQLYLCDLEELKRRYDETQWLGLMKEKAYDQYIDYLKREGEAIRKSDETITEREQALWNEQMSREKAIADQRNLEDQLRQSENVNQQFKTQQEFFSNALAAEKAQREQMQYYFEQQMQQMTLQQNYDRDEIRRKEKKLKKRDKKVDKLYKEMASRERRGESSDSDY